MHGETRKRCDRTPATRRPKARRRFVVIRHQSDQGLARSVAGRLLRRIRTGDVRTLALSGGRIAGTLFQALAQAPAAARWLRTVDLFWADERCVGPDDEASNYGLARRLLLQPLGITGERVHRLRGELPPHQAARRASTELRRVARKTPSDRLPALDLVLLGMGEDGHVASLFPGAPERSKTNRAAYAAVIGPKPPPRRLTLTYRSLAAAREVWVVVAGPGKEAALGESLRPTGTTPLAHLLRLRAKTAIHVSPGGADYRRAAIGGAIRSRPMLNRPRTGSP